ncbi:MAG: hypothetical protein WB992_06030 [Bryobacteraceae bacterium]
MQFRRVLTSAILLLFCSGFALQAQIEMNVQQLADFVRSELALKQQTDRKLGEYIRKIHLTEKLTDKTITDLEAQGAQPRTVEALEYLKDQTANLKPPGHDATYSPATAPDNAVTTGTPTVSLQPKAVFPPPDSVRYKKILDKMREYAMNYTQNLPNFICTQVTRRYVDPNMSDDHYRIIDTVLAKLGYNEGQEHYEVVSVNNRPMNVSMEKLKGGTVSTGEFGSLMRGIFEDKSETEFGWDHWATLRGNRMAVLNYFIDSGHSNYSIDYNGEQRIVTAYKGLVYADEDTGEITRITFVAVDIPKSFPVTAASERLDYDQVEISGQPYIVPLMATVWLTSGRIKTKNDIEFRLYRKFGTDVILTYDMKTPTPLSESQTQEQPADAAPPKPGSSGSKTAATKPASADNPWTLPSAPPPPPQ